MNAPANITRDKSYADLKFAFYQRMMSQRWRVNFAATGNRTWRDDYDAAELAAMEAALEARISSPLISTTERAECEAALTVIDVVREEQRALDDAYENRRNRRT